MIKVMRFQNRFCGCGLSRLAGLVHRGRRGLGFCLCVSLFLVSGVDAQARMADRVTVSGIVLAWDKKTITLFSQGNKVRVPRSAYKAKGALKTGRHLRVSYQFKDTPGYKSFVKALKKAKARKPASHKSGSR